MKAIILAAGVASRLRPLTDHTPKCLLKIGQRCLLERTLDALISNGIHEFVIVTGFLQEMIVDFVNTRFPDLHVTFVYNEIYASTNNIYSLYLAKEQVKEHPFLLLDSDIVFDPQIVSALLLSERHNALALNRHELGEEEIKLIVDPEYKVLEISKTCPVSEAVGESIGIEKIGTAYSKALFDELDVMIKDEGLDNVFYERAFERLTTQGHYFYAIDTTEFFSSELDTVEDFQRAKALIPPTFY